MENNEVNVMFENISKICIIGGSGTGKTTLADNLGNILNLPVYHIDGINYLKDWEERDKDQRDKIILEKVMEDKWVIDGTYSSTLSQRLENSDLVIYLDYSSLAQIKGIMGRYIKNHDKEKKEIPGCKERMNLKFFFWVLNWRKKKRNFIIEKISKVDKNKVIIFQNRRQLNKWYYEKFNTKIVK
jgi:adenylate kinase family enzyme